MANQRQMIVQRLVDRMHKEVIDVPNILSSPIGRAVPELGEVMQRRQSAGTCYLRWAGRLRIRCKGPIDVGGWYGGKSEVPPIHNVLVDTQVYRPGELFDVLHDKVRC